MATIFLIVLGTLVTAGSVYMVFQHRQMATWPTTSGQVIERGLENASPVENLRERYRAHIRYRYTVEGKTYECDRIQPADVVGGKAVVQKMLDRFGDEVTVHYNPVNPSEAFLMPLSSGWGWLGLATGLLLLIIGAGKLLLAAD